MDFKDILKTRRVALDLTLDDVARHVGVSGATVSRWENGDIENIRRDKIAKLAEILQVTPSHLMGWPENGSAENLKLDGVYLSMAAKVRDAGLTEKDLDIMLEMYKKAKELSGE